MKIGFITEENDIEISFWKVWGISVLLWLMTYLAIFVVFFIFGMFLGITGMY